MNKEINKPNLIDSCFVLESDPDHLVHVLICKECLLVDISPFADDILKSQKMHLRFHEYVKVTKRISVSSYPPFELDAFSTDFAEELDDEEQDDFWARSSRCEHWGHKLAHLDGKGFN